MKRILIFTFSLLFEDCIFSINWLKQNFRCMDFSKSVKFAA